MNCQIERQFADIIWKRLTSFHCSESRQLTGYWNDKERSLLVGLYTVYIDTKSVSYFFVIYIHGSREPTTEMQRSNRLTLSFYALNKYISKSALFEPIVYNCIIMDKLNECRDLMSRLCNLPSKEEELKKKFTDEEIHDISQTILLFDPEANQIVKRCKEIIDYIEGKTEHD